MYIRTYRLENIFLICVCVWGGGLVTFDTCPDQVDRGVIGVSIGGGEVKCVLFKIAF